MPYPMISETQKVGYDAERRFMDYMINVGFDAFKAPNIEDKKEHWDIHLMTKIDVKYMKKIRREDTHVQDVWTWLELKSVSGDDGWIYSSRANGVVFETFTSWVLVPIERLKALIDKEVDRNKKVTRRRDAKYKVYSRTIDEITLVETTKLKQIGWEMFK